MLRKAVGKKDAELIKQELGKFVEKAVARGIRPPHHRGDRPADRDVRPLRLQQVALGRVLDHLVPDGVAQDALPGRVHGGAAVVARSATPTASCKYINEARELGLEILPPDVNESGYKFTVVGDKRIRFGLGAIRNVGEGSDRFDPHGSRGSGAFTSSFDAVRAGRSASLQQARLRGPRGGGRMDSLGGHRTQLIEALEPAFAEAQLLQAEREAGQGSLFDDGKEGKDGKGGMEDTGANLPVPPALPDLPAWTEAERLAKEKEILGFFISGHPLERFRQRWSCLAAHDRHAGGMGRTADERRRSGHGSQAADLEEDRKGIRAADDGGLSWHRRGPRLSRRLGQAQPDHAQDAALLLTGGYSDRDQGEDNPPFIVELARPLAELKTSGALALSLRWRAPSAPQPAALKEVAALCSAHPGPTPLDIEWSDGNGDAVRLRSRRVRVAAEDDLIRALRDLLGAESVHYVKAG